MRSSKIDNKLKTYLIYISRRSSTPLSRVGVEVVWWPSPEDRSQAAAGGGVVGGKSQFRDDSKQSPRSAQCRPHHRPQAAQAGGGIVLLTCTGATLELGALGESLHVYV